MKIEILDALQQKSVLLRLCPCPRHAAAEFAAILAPVEISLRTNGTLATPQVKYAVSKLLDRIHGLAGVSTGVAVDGSIKTPFQIILTVNATAPEWNRRSPQSYTIRPFPAFPGSPGNHGLALTGASPIGLAYAVSTLAAALTASQEPGHLVIPLVEMLDYPQLEERGFWHWPPELAPEACERLLDWLYERKLNYWDMMVVNNGLRYPSRKYPELVGDDAFSRDNVLKRMVELGRERGIRIVAGIVHFEQHWKIVERYPLLAAEGLPAPVHSGLRPLCLSREATRTFFADILSELAELCGVEEAMAWLNEQDVSCACEQCRDRNEFVIQAEGIIAAWRMAQQKHPRLKLRLLLSQGSRCAGNDEIMAALPPDVKVSYYSGSALEHRSDEPATYTLRPIPVISPYIQRHVTQGHDMGLCADHHERLLCGMGLAELTRLRCVEAAEKGFTWLNGSLGNPAVVLGEADRHYAAGWNILAEYSWNPWGRPLEQALTAWCGRDGWSEPAAAAQALVRLDRVNLALINMTSEAVLRTVLDLARSRTLLDQLTNVVLEKGLGEEPIFRQLETEGAAIARLARARNWNRLAAVADLVQASAAVMRLAYPLWRWRENEGWLQSVQGTSVSQSRPRLARTRANNRAILTDLETADTLLQTAAQYLGRKSPMQDLAGLWQPLLAEYDLHKDKQ